MHMTLGQLGVCVCRVKLLLLCGIRIGKRWEKLGLKSEWDLGGMYVLQLHIAPVLTQVLWFDVL